MENENKKIDEKKVYVPKSKSSAKKSKPEKNHKSGIVKLVASSYVVVDVSGDNLRMNKSRIIGKLSIGEKIKIKE